jgi:hypothetical protein
MFIISSNCVEDVWRFQDPSDRDESGEEERRRPRRKTVKNIEVSLSFRISLRRRQRCLTFYHAALLILTLPLCLVLSQFFCLSRIFSFSLSKPYTSTHLPKDVLHLPACSLSLSLSLSIFLTLSCTHAHTHSFTVSLFVSRFASATAAATTSKLLEVFLISHPFSLTSPRCCVEILIRHFIY